MEKRILGVYILLIGITLFTWNTRSVIGSGGQFKRVYHKRYAEWFGGYSQLLATSVAQCASNCLKTIYCIGFQYKESGFCSPLTYRKLYSVTQLDDLDDENCYLYTGEDIADYIHDRIMNIRYKYWKKWLTWESAIDKCQEEGGRLIMLETMEKDVHMRKNVTVGVTFYIGLTDRVSEGDWRWVDGSSMTFDAFSPGQPNDYDGYFPGQGADCVAASGKGWMDDHCDTKRRFICERPP